MNEISETNYRKLSIFSVVAFGLIACILYGVGAGLRGDIGILLNPLADHYGISYEDVSICIAVMQIVFGAVQPVFGLVASRTSNRFVLIMGAAFLGISLIGMMSCHSFWTLMLFLGILFGCGSGMLAFGLILTSAIHFVGQKHAMMISGMLNASAGMVGFVFAPMIQALLNAGGLFLALIVMACIAGGLIPVAVIVTLRDPKRAALLQHDVNDEEEQVSIRLLLKNAFHNRTYRLLIAGFSTCGFHMVIIESHLFSQYTSYGIDETSASWAFSIYGIATIAGALLSGYLSTRLHKGRLLGFYYGFRAVWAMLYIFIMPKNFFTAVLYAIGLGMTGDATVSPTSGLVNEKFSLKYVAALIGILFFCHQIGAFLSAWLGGLFLEVTGGYQLIWIADACLCTFASIMSFRIRKEN